MILPKCAILFNANLVLVNKIEKKNNLKYTIYIYWLLCTWSTIIININNSLKLDRHATYCARVLRSGDVGEFNAPGLLSGLSGLSGVVFVIEIQKSFVSVVFAISIGRCWLMTASRHQQQLLSLKKLLALLRILSNTYLFKFAELRVGKT